LRTGLLRSSLRRNYRLTNILLPALISQRNADNLLWLKLLSAFNSFAFQIKALSSRSSPFRWLILEEVVITHIFSVLGFWHWRLHNDRHCAGSGIREKYLRAGLLRSSLRRNYRLTNIVYPLIKSSDQSFPPQAITSGEIAPIKQRSVCYTWKIIRLIVLSH